MPAPVPPGYTRGSILWIAASNDPVVTQSLRQWLWREAGGFGARLVLVTVEAGQAATLTTLHGQLASWECDQLVEIVTHERAAAANPAHVAAVEQATGIVLVGDEPRRWASTLGGTPLAQAIRRANARGKLVAGSGAVGAFLCQHMITPGPQPATLRSAVSFGPGLGLVNRLVVDVTSPTTKRDKSTESKEIVSEETECEEVERRLLAAVASNPFLTGVGLAAGSAAILYPDNTLQASGPNPLTLVDGQQIEAADLDTAGPDTASAPLPDVQPARVVGARHYTLHTGEGYNLDDCTLRPLGEIDLPSTGPVTSVL